MDTQVVNPTVVYDGPHAQFASITGSPFWGMSIDEIVAYIQNAGWTLKSHQRIDTPYGLGPLVHHFVTQDGRDVVWIPSYGSIEGERMLSSRIVQMMYWILWQAGVKVLLVGGTSGTNDWRETAIRPGDFVLPWSFYPDADMPGTLPGTEHAMGYVPNLVLLGDPFCTVLSRQLASMVQKAWTPEPFSHVHAPSDVRAVLINPTTGSFETDFQTGYWRTVAEMMSEKESGPPIATLHGDCVSPVLARRLGIHVGYYHIPVNWAQGHPRTGESIASSLDGFYEALPQTCLQLEMEVLSSLAVPTDCTCLEHLVMRPDVYQRAAMTPIG